MVLAHFRVRARVFLLLWHCWRWFARWRVFVEGGARLLYVPPPVSREGRARLARRACSWGGRKNFFLLCFSFASRYVWGQRARARLCRDRIPELLELARVFAPRRRISKEPPFTSIARGPPHRRHAAGRGGRILPPEGLIMFQINGVPHGQAPHRARVRFECQAEILQQDLGGIYETSGGSIYQVA